MPHPNPTRQRIGIYILPTGNLRPKRQSYLSKVKQVTEILTLIFSTIACSLVNVIKLIKLAIYQYIDSFKCLMVLNNLTRQGWKVWYADIPLTQTPMKPCLRPLFHPFWNVFLVLEQLPNALVRMSWNCTFSLKPFWFLWLRVNTVSNLAVSLYHAMLLYSPSPISTWLSHFSSYPKSL